ncbi:hypothetical protein F5887DRAFT_988176 [Amanita rubescens]|nr:hypothetical protein F5887DRAFT_988176 [Amanita rubescens]
MKIFTIFVASALLFGGGFVSAGVDGPPKQRSDSITEPSYASAAMFTGGSGTSGSPPPHAGQTYAGALSNPLVPDSGTTRTKLVFRKGLALNGGAGSAQPAGGSGSNTNRRRRRRRSLPRRR